MLRFFIRPARVWVIRNSVTAVFTHDRDRIKENTVLKLICVLKVIDVFKVRKEGRECIKFKIRRERKDSKTPHKNVTTHL